MQPALQLAIQRDLKRVLPFSATRPASQPALQPALPLALPVACRAFHRDLPWPAPINCRWKAPVVAEAAAKALRHRTEQLLLVFVLLHSHYHVHSSK